MTKRKKIVDALFDKFNTYKLKEAISILKKAPKMKFDETVEVAVKLILDPKQAQGAGVRGTVVLPHGTGKKVRAIVFCKGDEEKKAREAGADEAGGEVRGKPMLRRIRDAAQVAAVNEH